MSSEKREIIGQCRSSKCFVLDGRYVIYNKWGLKSKGSQPVEGEKSYLAGKKEQAEARVIALNAAQPETREFKLKLIRGKRSYKVDETHKAERNYKTEVCVGICPQCDMKISTIVRKEEEDLPQSDSEDEILPNVQIVA